MRPPTKCDCFGNGDHALDESSAPESSHGIDCARSDGASSTGAALDAAFAHPIGSSSSTHVSYSLDSAAAHCPRGASEAPHVADAGAKWILIDVGNVLFHFDHRVTCERICTLGGQGPDRVQDIFRFLFGPHDAMLSANDEMELGNKTLPEVGQMLRSEFGADLQEAALTAAWNSTFINLSNDLAKNAIAGLRRKGYRIGICSNTNVVHWTFLVDKADWLLDVDAHFLSFQMRARKPEVRFFKQIFYSTQCPAESHVLFDDLLPNIEGARRVRMHGEVFDSFERLESVVMNLPGW